MHFTQPANPPGLCDIAYSDFTHPHNSSILTVGNDGVLRQFHPSNQDEPPSEVFQVAGSAFNTLTYSKTVCSF